MSERLDLFADWVHTRWERDPRSRELKTSVLALGLCGEAAEVSEPIKKWLYSGKPLDRTKVVEELGDLLHYFVRACRVFDISFSEVMTENMLKLNERLPDGYAPVPPDDRPFFIKS